MNRLLTGMLLWLATVSAVAQTKPAATPPAVVEVIESVTGKQFQPDTVYAAFTDEDHTLLTNEPIANWGLPQRAGQMTYYNLVIGTRSYQLILLPASKAGGPSATLLRFATPKSKPEPIARGTLRPKDEKPK